jgi:hypothetical protein
VSIRAIALGTRDLSLILKRASANKCQPAALTLWFASLILYSIPYSILLGSGLGFASVANAECQRVTPKACPECFAVAGPLAEWKRIDAAMSNLDRCDPVVPNLTTVGNHDYSKTSYRKPVPGERDLLEATYSRPTLGYNTYFGTDRWIDAGYGCANPKNCSGAPGNWFIGGGDTIVAGSRNNLGNGPPPGPSTDQPGRHRAGIIRAPNGQRFLFLGAELAFDFPPATPGYEDVEGGDSAWLKQVLDDYPEVPTVFFHHSMFLMNPQYVYGPEIWGADSLVEGEPFDRGLGMEAIWNEVVLPYNQILMAFAGHVIRPKGQDDFTLSRPNGPDIAGFLRNYQTTRLRDAERSNYGVGWAIVAVFDPETDEVRVRSYRIDDTHAYAEPPTDFNHTGEAAATECFDMDMGNVVERSVAFSFSPDTRAPSQSEVQPEPPSEMGWFRSLIGGE